MGIAKLDEPARTAKKPAVHPVSHKAAERLSGAAVSVSTFAAAGVKELLPAETVLPPTEVAPFSETSIFGFDFGADDSD
ncbi:MAG: hypothetical protein Q7R35_01850 [Elusimicrobiota bacterium]|nr:hypothetical protein [Elusimicrobiota bacterium]